VSSQYESVKYTYRVGEVLLDEDNLAPVKDVLQVHLLKGHDNRRPPVEVSLGCHLEGAALPHADMNHAPTTCTGVAKRIGVKTPNCPPVLNRRLRRFTERFMRKHLTPLDSCTDVSLEHWLSCTDYTESRKQQLRDVASGIINQKDPRYAEVLAFIKAEVYLTFKTPRLINSRSDAFKTMLGPIARKIEKEVFRLPYFIKKIPHKDRASYIMNTIYQDDATVGASDYTSFECHFTRERMHSLENLLYMFMCQNMPANVIHMVVYMLRVLSDIQITKMREMKISVSAVRCSGEMFTSLGNGFSNLIICMFVCEENGILSLKIVVEGDDGLFTYYGTLTSDDFRRLGLNIKLERFDQISEASFCGLVFDQEDLMPLTDPMKYVQQIGWGDRKYIGCTHRRKMELLRSKALSLKHQYPGCPVLDSLSNYLLRVTSHHTVRENWAKAQYGAYKAGEVIQAIRNKDLGPIEPKFRSRLVVEKVFKVSVAKQLQYEQYFDNLKQLQAFDLDVFRENIPRTSIKNANYYVKSVDVRNDRERNYPTLFVDPLTRKDFSFLVDHKEESIRNAFHDCDKYIKPRVYDENVLDARKERFKLYRKGFNDVTDPSHSTVTKGVIRYLSHARTTLQRW